MKKSARLELTQCQRWDPSFEIESQVPQRYIGQLAQLCHSVLALILTPLKPPTESALPPRSDLGDGMRALNWMAAVKSVESGGCDEDGVREGGKKLNRFTWVHFCANWSVRRGCCPAVAAQAPVQGRFCGEGGRGGGRAARVVACAVQLVSLPSM